MSISQSLQCILISRDLPSWLRMHRHMPLAIYITFPLNSVVAAPEMMHYPELTVKNKTLFVIP